MINIIHALFGRRYTQAELQANYERSPAYRARCIIARDRLQSRLYKE